MRGLISIAATALFTSFYMSVAFAADGKVDFFDITKENANFVELAPGLASKDEKIAIIVHSYNQGLSLIHI